MPEERMHGDARSSDEIRRQIDRTRTDMDQTLVSLQNKLSSRGLVDELLAALHDKTRRARFFRMLRIGEGARKVSHVAREALVQIRASPLATAAAGLAAGVLAGALMPRCEPRQAQPGPRTAQESCFEKAEQPPSAGRSPQE